jgi:hypothetical protein
MLTTILPQSKQFSDVIHITGSMEIYSDIVTQKLLCRYKFILYLHFYTLSIKIYISIINIYSINP